MLTAILKILFFVLLLRVAWGALRMLRSLVAHQKEPPERSFPDSTGEIEDAEWEEIEDDSGKPG